MGTVIFLSQGPSKINVIVNEIINMDSTEAGVVEKHSTLNEVKGATYPPFSSALSRLISGSFSFMRLRRVVVKRLKVRSSLDEIEERAVYIY